MYKKARFFPLFTKSVIEIKFAKVYLRFLFASHRGHEMSTSHVKPTQPKPKPAGSGSLAHSLSFPGIRSNKPSLKQLINPNKFVNAPAMKQKLAKPSTMTGPSARLSGISRAEKSLTSLTTKFMKLLQESQNGILDLRNVNFSKIVQLETQSKFNSDKNSTANRFFRFLD
jgi:hypothetical protein